MRKLGVRSVGDFEGTRSGRGIRVARAGTLGGLAATLMAGLLGGASASSEPLAREEVPEPLRPWVDWVLRGHEEQRCPFLQGEGTRVCIWPGRLALTLAGDGGRFRQETFVAHASDVALPGGPGAWPEDVRVEGRNVAVLGADGVPRVRLAAGSHAIEGRFAWSELPPGLAVPSEIGLVDLTLSGRRIARPRRDVGGSLWLRDAKVEAVTAAVENRVDVEVVRRFEDAVPARLTTLIRLRVSGETREEVLGLALPAGWLATSISAPLPARLDPDGRLRVQLRPGDWTLELDARQEKPELRLEQPKQPADARWDESEVWSVALAPELRLLELGGAPAIDPTQAEIPGDWQALPTHRLDAENALLLVEKRRGNEGSAGDQLTLDRTWFIDFDGRGATVLDRLQGTLRRSLRVEMGAGTALGRVAVDGRDQPITRRGESESLGIETTLGPLSLDADSRIPEHPRRVAAVGWDLDVDQLSGRLLVPPGYRLLHVSGADSASATWVSRWDLLSVFFVLLVTVVCLRLFGALGAAWALATLVLVWNEPGAPMRIWLALAVGEALRRAVAHGRFARFVQAAQIAVAVVLVVIGGFFAVDQLRSGLFPALGRPGLAGQSAGVEFVRVVPTEATMAADQVVAQAELAQAELDGAAAPMAASPDAAFADAVEGRVARFQRFEKSKDGSGNAAGSGGGYDAYSSLRSSALDADPSATVPTGPGRPDWSWETVELGWSGPVTREHALGFWLIPPFANGLLAIARVLAVIGLAGFFARGWRSELGAKIGLGPLGLTASALAALALVAPAPVRADMPTPEMLEELRSRLLENSSCVPNCATISRLEVAVTPERLRLMARVETRAETGLALPGGGVGETSWLPESISQDGERAKALRRDANGIVWLRVGPGAHEIVLEGTLPAQDVVQLSLPFAPRRVVVAAGGRGWQVAGIAPDGTASGALQLVRDAASTSAATGTGSSASSTSAQDDPFEPSVILPYVELTRYFELGLRWQTETHVRRIAPADGPIVLEIPLVAGESVTTPGVRVEAGVAKLTLAAGEFSTRYASTLAIAPALELAAPADRPWSEVWLLAAAPIWHVDAEGIPPVDRVHEGARLREWRPWPGEKLRLAIERPAGLDASTRTIDRAQLSLAPGARATDATLHLAMRSSQGGRHVVTLPEAAELTSLVVNGENQPLRQEGRDVSISLAPGAREVVLGWREPRGVQALFRGSEVGLGVEAVNASVEIAVPEKRWLLYAMGPRLGPAVLIWSSLAVVAGLAWLVARSRLTPLSATSALLLGLGLTQASFLAAAIVVAWFVGLGLRGLAVGRLSTLPHFAYRGVQLGFVGLTFAAASALTWAIANGLLGTPDMLVGGNGSSRNLLRWYVDRSEAMLPIPTMFSLSIWWYRGVMLAWSMWLALALVEWARWGFAQWSRGGVFTPDPPAPSTPEAGSSAN